MSAQDGVRRPVTDPGRCPGLEPQADRPNRVAIGLRMPGCQFARLLTRISVQEARPHDAPRPLPQREEATRWMQETYQP